MRRVAIGVLVIIMILAAGCGKAGNSLKEGDPVPRGRVSVEFTVPSSDSQISDLLESLGSRIVVRVANSNIVIVSLPDGMAPPDMVQALNSDPLVKYAGPVYALDEIGVKFKVAHDDERVSDLLESLGSRITQSYEGSDFVLVSVPEDKTIVDVVETLRSSPLVEYAEPDYRTLPLGDPLVGLGSPLGPDFPLPTFASPSALH